MNFILVNIDPFNADDTTTLMLKKRNRQFGNKLSQKQQKIIRNRKRFVGHCWSCSIFLLHM